MAIGYASKVYHCLASKVRLKIIPLNRNAQILVKVLQVIWNLICSWIAVSSESYVSLEKGIKILILKSNIGLLWVGLIVIARVEFGHYVDHVVESEDADGGVELTAVRLLDDLDQHLQHWHGIVHH